MRRQDCPTSQTRLEQTPRQDDQRQELLSSKEAASLLGVCRTQMWRLAKKVKVSSTVLGTSGRPIHYFHLDDVLREKAERDRVRDAKARRQQLRYDSWM